jgi:hypothetical protein
VSDDDRPGTDPTRKPGRRPPAPYLVGAALVAVVVLGGGALVGMPPWAFVVLGVPTIGGPLLLWWRRRRQGRPGGMVTAALHVGGVGVATLLLIQAVPYGRAHANGPVVGEPAWANARTRQLMVDACFACHSNETAWPWYTNVAPLSWAVTDHVVEGRSRVNYSLFTISPGAAEETLEVILDGSMPPGYFTRFGRHPEARLSAAEMAELVAGLQATPGLAGDGDGRGRGGEYDDDYDDDGYDDDEYGD